MLQNNIDDSDPHVLQLMNFCLNNYIKPYMHEYIISNNQLSFTCVQRG